MPNQLLLLISLLAIQIHTRALAIFKEYLCETDQNNHMFSVTMQKCGAK